MAKRKHAELIKLLAEDDCLEIQVLNHKNEWSDASIGSIFTWPNYEYRIKPTKPSIDWDHVADEYKWLAKENTGHCYLYTHEPKLDCLRWHNAGFHCSASYFLSFKAGTCDWKDSLVQRPEGE